MMQHLDFRQFAPRLLTVGFTFHGSISNYLTQRCVRFLVVVFLFQCGETCVVIRQGWAPGTSEFAPTETD
jgi:hypothetical protein